MGSSLTAAPIPGPPGLPGASILAAVVRTEDAAAAGSAWTPLIDMAPLLVPGVEVLIVAVASVARSAPGEVRMRLVANGTVLCPMPQYCAGPSGNGAMALWIPGPSPHHVAIEWASVTGPGVTRWCRAATQPDDEGARIMVIQVARGGGS